MPTSDELCGTPCYMAPEVRHAGKKGVKRYSAPADWFTLGVLMYEMTEQRLPFGEDPRFSDLKSEWRKPKCLGEDGKKDDALLELVKGLLEWKPEKRLAGGKLANTPAAVEEVKKHRYWGDPEWALVELARLPSPLQAYVEARANVKPSEGKLRKRQQAAIETAVKMASVEAKQAEQLAALNSGVVNEGERKARLAALEGREELLRVDDWDFVSRHAIEAEYVENVASSVCLL
jgi:hypothetical protein